MRDDEICNLVHQAFQGSPRPKHFTNYKHCEECEEHDDLFRSRDIDTLEIDDINNGCWDPVCFLTPQGWLYYFPAFVRLTLENLEDSYFGQFLFFLTRATSDSFSLFNQEQKTAVLKFLRHVRDNHEDLYEGEESELNSAVFAWEMLIRNSE